MTFSIDLQALAESASMSTTCLVLGGHPIQVEVASTPQAQRQGLQHRSFLPVAHGMLFTYPDKHPRSFWMKDCQIPLDILFFQDTILVDYVDAAPPCVRPPCPVYTTKKPVNAVIELNAASRIAYQLEQGSQFFVCNKAP